MFQRLYEINFYLGFGIGLVVEVFKEEEEHDSVHSDPPDEGSWVVTLDEQQLEGMHHYTNKLHLSIVLDG